MSTSPTLVFHRLRSACLIASVYVLSICPVSSIAGDAETTQSELPTSSKLAPVRMDVNRWMVILCSLAGDVEHEMRLTEAVTQILSSAEPVFGIQPERIRVLLSSKEMAAKIQGAKSCNRGSLGELASELKTNLNSESQIIFFVLGHSHLNRRSCQFNIEGPDIDQLEYAEMFVSLPAKEQIHWVSLPASGFWIKSLSGKHRTIISATEASMEITATEMPYALGAILAGTSEHASLSDIDGDGRLTLLDLYLAVNIEIHMSFVTQDYVPTEHARLDDNGDGRGSELQEPFLPRKEGDPPVRRIVRRLLDGEQARQFRLYPDRD